MTYAPQQRNADQDAGREVRENWAKLLILMRPIK